MAKPLPPLTDSMLKSAEYLFSQQCLIANGQTQLIQELVAKYKPRATPASGMKDDVYYVVTSPLLLVDIQSTKFNLMVGSVIIKSGDYLLVMKGFMTFDKTLKSNTFFRGLKETAFNVVDLKGKLTTL